MNEIKYHTKHLSVFQKIIICFVAVIFLGAFLLMLPVSSQARVVTPFSDAIFTSTSAVCVTGLVVRDTASYWSCFGQAVILLLIQTGGLGVVTMGASLALVSGRKIMLSQRNLIKESFGVPQVGGIIKLTRFVILASLTTEFIGAALMMPSFCSDFGAKGIWKALFISISAFCNAGFDLMGTAQNQYASLTFYRNNPFVIIPVMLLIIAGGIGFFTWDDIKANKLRFKKYRMQSKVILVSTLILLTVPALFMFFMEYGDLKLSERIYSSLFQAVTPRTAGFNTADLTLLSSVSRSIFIILMLIGGAPGSTAGGMKVTTVSVLFANVVSVFSRKSYPVMFKRRLEPPAVERAATLLTFYISVFLLGGFIISIVEDIPLSLCLFETASAIGTVGLSLGLTPGLGTLSRIILIVMMFLGRVGGLTVIYATVSKSRNVAEKYPNEKITVG